MLIDIPLLVRILDGGTTLWPRVHNRVQSDNPPYTASFVHNIPGPAQGAVADCLWWPPVIPPLEELPAHARVRAHQVAGDSETGSPPLSPSSSDNGRRGVPDLGCEMQEPAVTVMLFIPGNPGLVQFYQNFLHTIHTAHPNLGILAHGHLGHSPRLNRSGEAGNISGQTASLGIQISSVIEAYDAIVDEYRDIGGCKVVLCGHSIGAWIATQVMRARPDAIDGAFLLFPTLSDLAATPNGQKLRVVLARPTAYILTALSYIISIILYPSWLLGLIGLFYGTWPLNQQYVLRSFLRSPRAVFSALTMGGEEMKIVLSLEAPTSLSRSSVVAPVADILRHEAKRIWVYFGDGDDWLTERGAKEVFSLLRQNGGALSDGEVGRKRSKGKFHRSSKAGSRGRPWWQGVSGEVVFGTDIPHDFCINHDVVIGQLCSKWLADGGLVVPS
ncbi:hypothetical protein DL93DRAFT_2162444 [Clavulina sp. PMI_390]|nr:hypothetical protein DL93DRAFT_2162444 [Clavulina sp. PMI_390]